MMIQSHARQMQGIGRRGLASLSLAGLILLGARTGRAEDKIGVVAAIAAGATAQPAGNPVRPLQIGSDIFVGDRIATGPDGRLQLLFLDGSSLSVGPDAELSLDRYRYDTTSRTGAFAASATQGVFRFVGGAISKAADAEFKTPTATVQIRGGIAIIDARPDQTVTATFLYGDHLRVTANGITEDITRPGYEISVAPGLAPLSGFHATTDDLRESLLQFQGPTGTGESAAGQALALATGDLPVEAALTAQRASNMIPPDSIVAQATGAAETAQLQTLATNSRLAAAQAAFKIASQSGAVAGGAAGGRLTQTGSAGASAGSSFTPMASMGGGNNLVIGAGAFISDGGSDTIALIGGNLPGLAIAPVTAGDFIRVLPGMSFTVSVPAGLTITQTGQGTNMLFTVTGTATSGPTRNVTLTNPGPLTSASALQSFSVARVGPLLINRAAAMSAARAAVITAARH